MGTELRAQDDSPYYLNGAFDEYIEYLIHMERIQITHHLNQPFTAKVLYDAISKDSLLKEEYMAGLLLKDLKRYLPEETTKGKLILGLDASPKFQNIRDKASGEFSATPSVSYSYKNILAYSAYTANTEYLNDTLLFGSVGKLLNENFGRTSTSYLRYDSDHLRVFYGRLDRNYGLINTSSLIRSDNPFSYDHFSFSWFNKHFKYSFSAARLDDVFGFDSREESPVSDWNRRFYSFHRLDLSLSNRFKIALTETILYGGERQQVVPAFFNPMNIFFLSKASDRRGLEEGNANAFGSIELYYKTKRTAFFAQFLIDDMDFTKALREQFPDRVGFLSRVIFTDLVPKSQFKIGYEILSNWTYNSFYTYGNYTFNGSSLGFPVNGFEGLTVNFDYFGLDKLYLSFDLFLNQRRDQDLGVAFTGEKSEFPIGIAQKLKELRFRARYLPKVNLSFDLQVGYESISNYLNQDNNNENFFNLTLSASYSGLLSGLL
ncbi:capsule assembly Wzi family protein [Roseivirga misakiensis]|uniref:TonB-dependent receptor-like beta-barrel domain-containing protein n=1 Tax=Roseivirga misakiensis TaxID=1563681 RepID=A0A1E5T641_9BACT|nr:capsule assembly Wzi family protein [Roseivirga misakiensis]OEK06767.1 hypothetical protein BFP71_03650 [Roseivirga misakiensis]